jgi:hypothetical protein
MASPDRVLGHSPLSGAVVGRVARSIERVEESVALSEVARWGDQEILRIDLTARARAAQVALDHDLALYDRGMAAAGGDPVKAELVLRYLEDQNRTNRALIDRRFGP